MGIKLDISPTSIVIYCTDCGHWRGFAFEREDAETRGAAHEERVHPDDWTFRRQVLKNRTRRAGRQTPDSIDDQQRPDDLAHGNLRTRLREARS